MAYGWIKYFSKIIFIDVVKSCIFSSIYNFTMQSIFTVLLKQPDGDQKRQISWLHVRLYHKGWSDFWVVSHFICVGAYLISYVCLYMHIYITYIYTLDFIQTKMSQIFRCPIMYLIQREKKRWRTSQFTLIVKWILLPKLLKFEILSLRTHKYGINKQMVTVNTLISCLFAPNAI